MSEPRCGLIHMQSGHALAKLARGDCDAAMSDFALAEKTRRKLRRTAYEFKLQVATTDSSGQPELIWIRIGVHPQRCLCAGEDGRVRLENWLSPAAPEPQWRLHLLEAQETNEQGEAFPALCFLQNVKTGRFLSVEGGAPCLATQGDLWGLMRLRTAMTPGKVLRRGALVSGGGVAVASVGAVGVVGASAVGAAVRGTSAAAAVGTAVSTAVGAVSTLSIAKAAAAVAAIPGAVTAAVAAAGAATAAVATMGGMVQYAVVGAGCGAVLGTAGAAAATTARLVGSAKDPGLYVQGYPFLPAPLARSASRLSTLSKESKTLTRGSLELADSESEPELEVDE